MKTVQESVPCSASINRSAARRSGSALESAITTLSVGPSSIIVVTPWRCISTWAIAVANRIAPEHLQVAVDDSVESETVDAIVNAGEILVGQHTPFSAANFVIGCPASLPTSGFAHVSSGITAMTFLKRTAVAKADAVALRRMAPSVIALADHEGFPAHAAAIRRRQA